MRQQHVGAFHDLAVADQRLALEGAVQGQLRVQPQLQCLAGVAQDPAQQVRSQRRVLGLERRPRGEHAEALAQQLQRDADPRRFAPGDIVQHDVAVDVHVGDQGQHLHRRAGLVLAQRGGRGGRQPQRGQGRFQLRLVERREARAARAQALQFLIDILLQLAVAGAFGLVKQCALQFGQGRLQRGLQRLPQQGLQRLQDVAHARGQDGACERRRACRRSGRQ